MYKGLCIFTNNKRNNMKKMTSYIVTGVKADDEAVFMQRVGELLERKGLLEFLTDGVPVGIRLVDDEELLKYVNKDRSSRIALEIVDVSLNDDLKIIVKYKYISLVYYFKTEEDKDSWVKDSYYFKGDKSEKPTEEFTIKGERISTDSISYPVNQKIPGVDIWLV